MSRLLLAGALGALLAQGCTSCSSDGERDAGSDASAADADSVVDADRDADPDVVGDGDRDDGGDGDMDADDEGDVDVPLPAPVPMELVEIPHDRPGRDCGPGCRQVTFAAFLRNYDVSDNYIVYMGVSGDFWPLYLVDLTTMTEYRIDSCEVYQCGSPAVHDDVVAYPTGPWDADQSLDVLWRYQIGDPSRHALVQRRMTSRGRPLGSVDVHGDLVAWYDSMIDPAGLYAMSLDGGEVVDLTHERCLCYGSPHLHGREVVYDGWQTGNRDIWMVNVDTLVEEHLVDHRAPQFESAFDGRWVVWSDGRNDPSPSPYDDRVNPDIYGMNLDTREVEPICAHPAVQLDADVRDGLVVWRDWRNAEDPNDAWAMGANTDIYLLDLDTRREVQVTSMPGTEQGARVWGRRVFFAARDLTGMGALFMVDLDEAGLLE